MRWRVGRGGGPSLRVEAEVGAGSKCGWGGGSRRSRPKEWTSKWKAASEHKADLSIWFQGELRFVDGQVTCPATHAQVCRNAHLVPGTAADKAYRRKLSK